MCEREQRRQIESDALHVDRELKLLQEFGKLLLDELGRDRVIQLLGSARANVMERLSEGKSPLQPSYFDLDAVLARTVPHLSSWRAAFRLGLISAVPEAMYSEQDILLSCQNFPEAYELTTKMLLLSDASWASLGLEQTERLTASMNEIWARGVLPEAPTPESDEHG